MQAALPAQSPRSVTVSRVVAGWLAVCIAAALAVSLSWWALLAPGAGSDSEELVIEAGTAEAIAKGYPVFQPGRIELRPGGTLTIVNNDITEHTVGWVTVPPGRTSQITAPPGEGDIKFDCTTHPSGTLGLSVVDRLPLWQAVFGALVAGGVMGGVAAGVTAVTRALDAG